jgi:S1-C subfamily serine protease
MSHARPAALAAFFMVLAWLPACQSERVAATALRPHPSLAAALPMPGSLHVRLAPATREQRSYARFSNVTSQVFHVGRELEDAALLVARRYFRDAALLTPESRTHYVLSIDFSARGPGNVANNEVGLLATLYAADGHVLHRDVTFATTPPFGGEDRATYFNAYVDAVQRFLDAAVLAKRGEMELDLASRAPGRLAFEHREGELPLRVEFTGTGTRVSGTGIVATARHVAKDCLGFARVEGRQLIPMYVLDSDPRSGVLMLLDAHAGPAGHVQVDGGSAALQVGATINVLDHARTAVTDAAVRWIAGTVRAPSRTEDDPGRLLLDIPLPPGSRGGPAFDAEGRFVGIVLNSADVAADAGPAAKPSARLHAAIPARAVQEMLDAHAAPTESEAGSTDAPVPAADARAAAVVRIACVE